MADRPSSPLCVAPYCCFHIHLGIIDAVDECASFELDWSRRLSFWWRSCTTDQEGQKLPMLLFELAFC